MQDGDRDTFDALLARFHATREGAARRRLLRALASTTNPELADRARALSLDPGLRVGEVWTPLYRQSAEGATRADTWHWIERHFDALVERAGRAQSGSMPWLAAGFCDDERAAAVEAFLSPRVGALAGGPRNLAASLEAIRLCAALVRQQGPDTDATFADPITRDPGASR